MRTDGSYFSDHKASTETNPYALCELQSVSTASRHTHIISIWTHDTRACVQGLPITFTWNFDNSLFELLSSFTLVNCLWIFYLFMYINICVPLTHFLSDTHTHSTSQSTPGTDKGSFMFAGLSWGQRVLVLRASFSRSELGCRRNEKKPYISRCFRVKDVLLA